MNTTTTISDAYSDPVNGTRLVESILSRPDGILGFLIAKPTTVPTTGFSATCIGSILYSSSFRYALAVAAA